MPRQRFKPEQIIGKLREVEVAVAKGSTMAEACRQIGVTEQTLYRWRREYGGMRVDQPRRMKELEAENNRQCSADDQSALSISACLASKLRLRGESCCYLCSYH